LPALRVVELRSVAAEAALPQWHSVVVLLEPALSVCVEVVVLVQFLPVGTTGIGGVKPWSDLIIFSMSA